MAKFYDKSIDYKTPLIETFVLKGVTITEIYHLSIDNYKVEFTKSEKDQLIEEWGLMERLNKEWKELGIDNLDEYIDWITAKRNLDIV